MRYSLNQIEHTVRKAARGAGLSWGVAEDAGRAARWLHMVGVSGAALVASVLEDIDHADIEVRKVQQARASLDMNSSTHPMMILKPKAGALSPLVVGPCIGDWANAIEATSETNEIEIAIKNVIHPLLLAGYCGVAAQQTRLAIFIKWDGYQMRCTSHGARMLGTQNYSRQEDRVVIASVETDLKKPCENATVREARIGSAEVDGAVWDQLNLLSHRTYVEATESSRLSGAGAGLNDND